MSHPHKRYADADATTESLLLITKKIDQQGLAIAELKGDVKELKSDVKELQAGQAELRGDVKELRGDVKELRGSVGRIEDMLAKILDGQAVLHQNGMELKRRLDARS